MATIDLSALTALQNANKKSIKPTAKEKQNVPAKSLTQRAVVTMGTTQSGSAENTPAATRELVAETPNESNVINKPAPIDSASSSAPDPSPEGVTDVTSAPVPADDVVAFAKSLEDLEQLIANDNPIRDATMQIIERCQAAPHLADFLYENEDAFAIGLRALRKLHTQRTEKRGEYRAKQQKKQESVNVFMADLGDLKL